MRHIFAGGSYTQPWRPAQAPAVSQSPRLVAMPLLASSLGAALVNCSHTSQQEKFFRAVQRGHVGEVKRLLNSKGVDVKGRHELGWTALHLAAVNGRQEVCRE